jgi:hypothetical protein
MDLIMKQIRQTVDNLIEAQTHENKYEFTIIKSTLNGLLRKWHDYEYPCFVSTMALDKSKELGVNLWEKRWPQQPTFDKGRKIFIMEHKYPVTDVIKDMIANPNDITKIFKSQEFGWILRSEDAKLKSHDRGDHTALYEEAGIKLMHRQN